MYAIALTGLIGSGKSTIAQHFKDLGISTIDTDHLAKTLRSEPMIIDQISAIFGPKVVGHDKQIKVDTLRQLILQYPDKKAALEQLLHPKIRQIAYELCQNATSDYAIIEVPILKSRSDYPFCQRILATTSPIELRQKRILARGGLDLTTIASIMDAQATLKPLLLADDVIHNDQGLSHIKQQVATLHRQYLQLAKTNTS